MKDIKQLMEEAKECGLEGNYFFVTTLERYQMQLQILEELKKQIEDDGAMVTKEYVKGRENVYTHPAISNYNKTCDSANKTAGALMKMINDAKKCESGKKKEVDPLLSILRGDKS